MTRLILPAAGLCLVALAADGGPPNAAFQPKSMAYVLQADKLARNRADAVAKLASCGRDLVVIDQSHSGEAGAEWTAADLQTIRTGRAGRKVVCYLSIGEAEDYRPYWRKDWDADKDGRPDKGAPDFLCTANPDWQGNYRVKYWRKEWQEIILRAVDRIVAQGFDGVYLDIVDGFEFFEEDRGDWIDNRPNPETGGTYRKDMMAWVLKIAARARAAKANFLVIPQNGSQLADFPEYLRTVDAIGVEDLFTDGNKVQKDRDTNFILGYLRKFLAAGKPVLMIEYGRSDKARRASIEGARKNGLVLLLTDRNLTTLGDPGGPEP